MAGRRTIVLGVLNKIVTVLIRLVPRRIVLAAVDARQARRRSAQRT
jgi:short-subunit dehydrogenase